MELITSKYENIKDQLTQGLVFVEFFTTWCGDCHVMAPTIEKLYQKFKSSDQVKFFKINAEESEQYKDNSSKYKIERIPTHLLLNDGEIIESAIEYQPYQKLESWILNQLK